MNETIEKLTPEGHYKKLCNTGTNFKEALKEACDISEATFYRYLSNPELMPKLVREKYQELAGIEIQFPEV